jgi:hypothetical protein
MSQGDSQNASGPAGATGGWRRLGTPAAIALAGLIAVGGYQFFYAKKNYAYLIERDHRVLAARARQIGEAIAGERQMLLTLSELRCRLPGGVDEALRKLREQYEVKIAEAEERQDAAAVPVACGERKAPPGSAPPAFRGLLRAPDGYHLEFHYQDLRASVPLKELLEPLLASNRAFATILLADAADGTVFYQRPEGNLPSLQALLSPASPAGAAVAKGAAKAAAESGDAGQAALRSLRSAGPEVDVELQGRKFKLFVQPLTLPAAAPEAVRARPPGRSQAATGGTVAGGREGEDQELLLCGLVPADELLYGSIELSPQVLGAAIAVLLLALLSWPLLKLQLLGEHRRLRLADVVMVAACSLLGVSWLTLSLLGLRQHRYLERLADGQLASFASGMAGNVEEELRRAYAQLVSLEGAAAGAVVVDSDRHDVQDLHGDLLAWRPGLLAAYPFAESFTLVRANGSTALRWTTDKVALAPRDEAPRPHVRRVTHGDLWRLPPPRFRPSDGGSGRGAGAPAGLPPAADPGGPFTVESMSSSISGVRQAVLAKPAAAGPGSGVTVATLALPMLSVIRPVTPPDLEFAVIDDSGAVLFHSDPERNKIENLFVETDQDLHLRSAVLARHRATLDQPGPDPVRPRARSVRGRPRPPPAARGARRARRALLPLAVGELRRRREAGARPSRGGRPGQRARPQVGAPPDGARPRPARAGLPADEPDVPPLRAVTRLPARGARPRAAHRAEPLGTLPAAVLRHRGGGGRVLPRHPEAVARQHPGHRRRRHRRAAGGGQGAGPHVRASRRRGRGQLGGLAVRDISMRTTRAPNALQCRPAVPRQVRARCRDHPQLVRISKGGNKRVIPCFLYVLPSCARTAMILSIRSIRRAVDSCPAMEGGSRCAVHTG